MASLLDFILQQQRGPQAGLMAGGGTPPEANPLGALVGAQQAAERRRQPSRIPTNADALLTEQDRQSLQQQKLLNTGLGILSADPGQGDLSRIAQGVMLGGELGREAKQDLLRRRVDMQELAIELREEQQKDRLRSARAQLFAGADLTNPQHRTQIMETLLAIGDFEGADRLNTFESNLPDPEFVENGQEMIVYDPRTLEEKDRIQTPDERPEGTKLVNRGTQSDLVDMDTGEVITSFTHAPDPKDIRDMQKFRFKKINDLADDFRSEAGDFQDVANAVSIGLEAPLNAAGTVTLFTMMTRAIDPGVSVRESDIKRGEAATTFQGRAKNLYNKWLEEGQLNEEQRKWMKEELLRIGVNQRQRLQPIIERYTARAQAANVNPDFITFDPFTTVEPIQAEIGGGENEEMSDSDRDLDSIIDRNLPGGN